jgi:hypothetical protein
MSGLHVARVELRVLRGAQPKPWVPQGGGRSRRSRHRRSSPGPTGWTAQRANRTASLYMRGGLTAWARGLTARLCSVGSLTTWACGLTTNL